MKERAMEMETALFCLLGIVLAILVGCQFSGGEL